MSRYMLLRFVLALLSATLLPAAAFSQSQDSQSVADAARRAREKEQQQDKQALSDLDLLQRKYRLDQDTFYSNTNNASDTAGKQKLDDEKQQISDKREEVERLKAKLADLQQALGITESTAPKP